MPIYRSRKYDLKAIAKTVLAEHGLETNFPNEVLLQVSQAHELQKENAGDVRDLTNLPWCSIDNDDSRDLDQISASEELGDGKIRVWVAVADVDALVPLSCPVDKHAAKNTTSIYTGLVTFPMLPEGFSCDLSSLNAHEGRAAIVIEMVVDPTGALSDTKVYRAWVKNKSKLAYNAVAAWLEGQGPLPTAAAEVPGMDAQLKMQDRAAQALRLRRYEGGALDLETIKARPVVDGDMVTDLVAERQNRAQELIEDLMVAANGITARFLNDKGYPTIRRVVRSPERWQRIVELAGTMGEELPGEPDSKALNDFLMRQKAKDPFRFPDLSLTVVKLMGRGEYVPQAPGQTPIGHFGLAVKDYNHSTAPNRRYPDVITQRQIKAALQGGKAAYSLQELGPLGEHCTLQEGEVNKAERQVRKSAAAILLEPQVGRVFYGLVTGASPKGTWVRIFKPPVEGRVVSGEKGLDVGDRCQVKLLEVDVLKGFIDFAVERR
jgi:exoribonuclease-2